MKSMTGYGHASDEHFGVEIRSLNHRFCEINFKLPHQLAPIEPIIRDHIRSIISRGRLYITVSYESPIAEEKIIHPNLKLANLYKEAFDELAKEFNVENDIKLSHLIHLNGVLHTQDVHSDPEKIWPILEKVINCALDELNKMRTNEGHKIAEDIYQRIEIIKSLVKKIEEYAPKVVEEHREKLHKRLNHLIDSGKFDEYRLNMELALHAEKSDITEELVRISSHLDQLATTIQKDEPVGRQLDFLLQELYREVNTIGSKTGNLEIINTTIQLKSELEKIREQVQNIE
jgi:uncharacterized protein (TIGR00255 family)